MSGTNEAKPILYHAGSSFYSQLTRLALAEKEVEYTSRVVDMLQGENTSIDYLRSVNPKGTVPAMEHKGVYFTESKDIVEYVDTLSSQRPRLCPQGDSEQDARNRHFWLQLDLLNIPVITYGSLYHNHLSTNVGVPSFIMNKRRMTERLTSAANRTKQIKEEHPDLAPKMEGRRDFEEFQRMVTDEGVVLEALQKCDDLFAEVEEELAKQKQKFGDGEYWLCGTDFTVADVYLSCTLHRLVFAGQSQRLFQSKRPLITDYYERVLKRNTFAKKCVYANSLFWSMGLPMIQAGFWRMRPYFIAAWVVGAGIYAYRNYKSVDGLQDRLSAFWMKYGWWNKS